MSAHPLCVPESRVLAQTLGHLPPGCTSVLDIGSGLGAYLHAIAHEVKPKPRTIALDAYQPYLDAVDADEKLCGLALPVLRGLDSRSVDAVICIDMIEHLTALEGQLLLREIRRVARRRAIIFTPLGFHPQDSDGWGLGGDHWQTHRSGWSPSDFAPPYSVEVWPDFTHGKPELPPGALWAFFERS